MEGMMPLAVEGAVAVLAIIGLVVGLIVFFVVIFLLQSTLAPLLRILASVQDAKTAPMLERGVPGTDQLGQTRRLAETVPELALAYLAKLGAGGGPSAPAPPPPTPTFSSSQPKASFEQPRPELPAWQRYGQ
jgi:hypothetical protein